MKFFKKYLDYKKQHWSVESILAAKQKAPEYFESKNLLHGAGRLEVVVPLFKKGGKEKSGNYRLVTLVVGKFLEEILRNKISMYLESQGLIRDSQHGIKHGKSCLTNLIEFFEEVTRRIDEGRAVDVIYMDFSKEFDKVPHGRLVNKFKSNGIQGELAIWIQDWLECRRQTIVVEGCFSDWRPVTNNMPHGSVLGPLLPITYMNDSDVNIGVKVSKFVDDTKVGYVGDSKEGYLLRVRWDLDQMGQWAKEWQVEFYFDKCEVQHF
eukprot:g42725.t1